MSSSNRPLGHVSTSTIVSSIRVCSPRKASGRFTRPVSTRSAISGGGCGPRSACSASVRSSASRVMTPSSTRIDPTRNPVFTWFALMM